MRKSFLNLLPGLHHHHVPQPVLTAPSTRIFFFLNKLKIWNIFYIFSFFHPPPGLHHHYVPQPVLSASTMQKFLQKYFLFYFLQKYLKYIFSMTFFLNPPIRITPSPCTSTSTGRTSVFPSVRRTRLSPCRLILPNSSGCRIRFSPTTKAGKP